MNIKLDNILFLAFFILVVVALLANAFWVFTTEKRLKRFFVGKKAKDLEDTIIALQDQLQELQSAKDRTDKEITAINQKLKKSVRGLETIRFNPFADQGSNQSFAVGMLNEEGDGVILSSLYARDRMSVFAKPIKNGKSEFELTNEERDVLAKAVIK